MRGGSSTATSSPATSSSPTATGTCTCSDFGLTREAGEGGGLTRTGMFVGTTDYAAPEQIKGGEIDGRADVCSLGRVLDEVRQRAPARS